MDEPISQNQQDVVNLFLALIFNVFLGLSYDFGEISRTHLVDPVFVGLVRLNNFFLTLDLGIFDVTIQGEAIAHFLRTHKFRDCSKTVKRIFLIRIIFAKNVSDRLQHL